MFLDYIQVLSNNSKYNLYYLKRLVNTIIPKSKNNNEIVNENLKEFVYLDDPRKITIDNFISILLKKSENKSLE